MTETYQQMKLRHMKEIDAIPSFCAFNIEQFQKGVEELGVTDVSELCQVIDGIFFRKSDMLVLKALSEKHYYEMRNALRNDKDFLYKAVRCELSNAEYFISEDMDDVLDALGLEYEKLNKRMRDVVDKAVTDYMSLMEETR